MATRTLSDAISDGRKTTQPVQPTTEAVRNALAGVKFNRPSGWVDEYGGNGESMGVSMWDQYFTGLEGLGEGYAVEGVYGQGSAGVGGAPSTFTINRADPNGNKNVYQQRQLIVNPDGTVSWADGSNWTSRTQQSQMGHFLEAGLPMALGMAGGMYATGGLSGGSAAAAAGGAEAAAGGTAGAAGAGTGAAGAGGSGGLTLGGATGGGLSAAPGAGLSLAAPTGAGTGLAATAGPGLTLAAPTGTGAGLSVAGAGAAGASSLPSWLTSMGGKVAGNVGGKVLGGMLAGGAAAAATGNDKVNAAGLQGVANTLGTIGNEQLDIARALYKDAQGRITVNDQLFTQIIQNALNQQTQQAQRSDQLWDAYMADFMPNAKKFAQTALNYDTAGRRDAAGAAARAAVETESAMQRQAQQRALGRAGVSIDSGRALTLDNLDRLNQTKVSTGADLDARRKVEETGLNLNLAAANLGQGIAGTSQQAAGQSLTAGNAATGTLATKESTRNATLAPTQAFYGGATSATGSAGNVLNGVVNIDASNRAAKNAGLAGLGSLAGTILTADKDSIIGGALDWLSDPKSKKVHGKVSGKKALADIEDTPVKEWTYKPGMGDEGTHVGRMAGEGDPMGRDGMRRIDPISEVGKLTAAVQQLSTDVKQIQRRLSLADA